VTWSASTSAQGSNIQDGTVIHADPGFPALIGATSPWDTTPCCTAARVGDGSLIGIGAVVLNGAKIGRNCLIGAGALVTEGMEIPDGSVVSARPQGAQDPVPRSSRRLWPTMRITTWQCGALPRELEALD
jgi:carbonic anhydrase/acetyltransferase-like protein (isoleucine patch superfamily)